MLSTPISIIAHSPELPKGNSLTFSAQRGRGKEKKLSAEKKSASPSEGAAEGGCGGNSAAPELKRSPAALLVQSRVPQKSFLFLLEENEIARQIKKCEENFFAEQRAKRVAAGRSESVGILFKMSSDFFQQTPPKLISCLARRFAPRFGRHFRKEMPRVFEINRQFSRRKAAVHKFKNLYCGKAAMSQWFSSAFGGIQNEILINCRCNT